jgi:hypothetical protein
MCPSPNGATQELNASSYAHRRMKPTACIVPLARIQCTVAISALGWSWGRLREAVCANRCRVGESGPAASFRRGRGNRQRGAVPCERRSGSGQREELAASKWTLLNAVASSQRCQEQTSYQNDEIRACEEADITVTTLPKPMTSGAKAAGRFGKQTSSMSLPTMSIAVPPASG